MKLKNKIQSIIEALKESDINHIEISSFWGAQKIKMIKNISSNEINVSYDKNKLTDDIKISKDKIEQINEIPSSENNDKPPVSVDDFNAKIFKSPLVGTYYQSSKPEDPPFVEKNQKITKGQVVCIIEAMKIFNEIESEYSGQIVEILVKNGDPIEYDQPLFKIIED